ncbi:hypothetical protein DFA_04035 [Cavenderia fasciculata]|uniref:protein-tyrosine-phosphatase n=1 Tax=Cavenderia fasciculata TaxID=261658 RepID=F4Q140_CACFS|nr:uncharacterized protein DFA_04035 [Cavenderia fasciculata]EGG18541.1 hypothetical protein DFA_04035 [Cavenderia fasciculata]|eukprot:XP_004366445.1 hypothetical protein DFA_04035 [Cavenderia fasciculata]
MTNQKNTKNNNNNNKEEDEAAAAATNKLIYESYISDFDFEGKGRDVQTRCQAIRAEADSIIMSLRNRFTLDLLQLPPSIRSMNMKDFLELYCNTQQQQQQQEQEQQETTTTTTTISTPERNIQALAEIKRQMVNVLSSPIIVSKMAEEDIPTSSSPETIALPGSSTPTPTTEKTLNQQIEEKEGLGKGGKKFSDEQYSTPSEILPFLYLAGVGGTERDRLVPLGIAVVINVAEEFQTPRFSPESDNIVEHRVWIQDMVGKDENQHDSFYRIFEIFDNVERNNQKCLIHCKHGRSRSASAVIAYLMYKNRWSLRKSMNEVKSKRPLVGPHRHLTLQLIEWEKVFLQVQKSTISTPVFAFIKVKRGRKCITIDEKERLAMAPSYWMRENSGILSGLLLHIYLRKNDLLLSFFQGSLPTQIAKN